LGFLPDEVKLTLSEVGDSILIDIQVPEEDSGVMIGTGGEVLMSIQRLVRVIFYNQFDGKRIKVNINQYRQTRQAKLEQLAQRVAEDVLSSGRGEMIRRQLSSYERFIIHNYITENHPNLKTVSSGEGGDRHIFITPKNTSKT
jgi:spoIIIJ-associated protein